MVFKDFFFSSSEWAEMPAVHAEVKCTNKCFDLHV